MKFENSNINLISIIIPTYNEAENISILVEDIQTVLEKDMKNFEIIIVDDNSTDGTIEIVQELMNNSRNIKLIIREELSGVTSAILKGITYASGDIYCVMDGDLSHPPKTILSLVDPIINDNIDFTIASRYISGGATKNWPLKRKIISRTAKLLALPFTRIKDPLSGFMAFRKSVINNCEINNIGNKISLELISKGKYNEIIEIPYVFQERSKGTSKLDIRVSIRYINQLLNLVFVTDSTIAKFIRFCIVGLLGTFLNLAILYLTVDIIGIFYIYGGTISTISTILFNYTLNKKWTFNYRSTKNYVSFFKSIIVSIMSIVNILVLLYIFVNIMGLWHILGMIFAISINLSLNFLLNKIWVFKKSEPSD